MNLWENIELAFTGLILNKMRSFLTMLGIIIGIGAVIAIYTIGDSFTNYLGETMQSMGANNITVYVHEKDSEVSGQKLFFGNQEQQAMEESNKIKSFMIDDLNKEYSNEIAYVSLNNPVGTGKTKIKQSYSNLNLIGVNEGYIKAKDLTLTEGRFFSEKENQSSKKLCVVSDKYLSSLGLKGNVIGKPVDIKVNDIVQTFTIVGVYQYEQDSMGASSSSEKDLSTDVYIPITIADQMNGNSSYQSFTVVTKVGVDSTNLAVSIETFMKNYYKKNHNYTISAMSMQSMVDTMSSMLDTLKLAISAIAAIALLVGGIGVMNIMLVSITERTREIGTRKALGANNTNIRIQFITESALICLIGGIIGVIFGTGLGMVVASVMGYPGSASIVNILVAVGFSLAIGVFFGYYPANKAAKLDPIEALRYE